MIRPQIADPGQRATDLKAPFDRRGLEQQAFNLGKTFHGVGQTRAPQTQALYMVIEHFAYQVWVV